MLLFRSEEHVNRWCRRWKLRRGAILSLEQGLQLTRAWYADRLHIAWRPKTPDEAEAVFDRLGLRSTFWRLLR